MLSPQTPMIPIGLNTIFTSTSLLNAVVIEQKPEKKTKKCYGEFGANVFLVTEHSNITKKQDNENPLVSIEKTIKELKLLRKTKVFCKFH